MKENFMLPMSTNVALKTIKFCLKSGLCFILDMVRYGTNCAREIRRVLKKTFK
jgi:hypothetical protein